MADVSVRICAAAIKMLAGLAALALIVCGAAAEQPARVALVVGVGKYVKVAELPNTVNDARAIGASLQRLGFDVDLVLDPDKPALDGAIRRFGERAAGAETALFYYAG